MRGSDAFPRGAAAEESGQKPPRRSQKSRPRHVSRPKHNASEENQGTQSTTCVRKSSGGRGHRRSQRGRKNFIASLQTSNVPERNQTGEPITSSKASIKQKDHSYECQKQRLQDVNHLCSSDDGSCRVANKSIEITRKQLGGPSQLQILSEPLLAHIVSYLGEIRDIRSLRSTCNACLEAVVRNRDASLIVTGRHSVEHWSKIDLSFFGKQFRFLSMQVCNIPLDIFNTMIERHSTTLRGIEMLKIYTSLDTISLLTRPERYPVLQELSSRGLQGVNQVQPETERKILHLRNQGTAFSSLCAVSLVNMILRAPLVHALMSWGCIEEVHLAGSEICDMDQFMESELSVPQAASQLRSIEATFIDQTIIHALISRLQGAQPCIVNYLEPNSVPKNWGIGIGRLCARSGVMARDKYGRSVLHVLAMASNQERQRLSEEMSMDEYFQLLFRLGADIEQRDNKSRTALHVACTYNQPAILRALYHSCERGPYKITEAMLLKTVGGETPLYVAALKGFSEMVQIMCNSLSRYVAAAPSTIQVQVRHDLVERLTNTDLWTPLHGAAVGGHIQCAEALLDFGFHPQMKTRNGDTTLHIASFAGHIPMLRTLLSRGGKLHAKDEKVANKARHSECADFVRAILGDKRSNHVQKNDSSQQRGSGANRRQRHKNKLLKQGDTGNSLSRRQIHAKFPTRYQQNPDQESNTQQHEIEAR